MSHELRTPLNAIGVLNFARLGAGTVAINPATVGTDSLMNTVEAMITPQLQARRLQLVRHTPEDLAGAQSGTLQLER